MACGSVYSKESQNIGRDLSKLELSPRDNIHNAIKQRSHHPTREGSPTRLFGYSGSNGQEAIRFLQNEHEKVLEGLHSQMQHLQQKCDDLQFEAHLRHITINDENTWKKQIDTLNEKLELKEIAIKELEERWEKNQKKIEDISEQSKWREIQLHQQMEVGEQKIVDLREECFALRAKVKDLKVYCAALRRGEENPEIRRPDSMKLRDRAFLSSETSDHLENDMFSGSWKENRLTNSFRRKRIVSGASIDKPMLKELPSKQYIDLSNSLSSTKSRQSDEGSRPGSVMLPPINLSQSVGRPQFRQHMRFASAPPGESKIGKGLRRDSNDEKVKRLPE